MIDGGTFQVGFTVMNFMSGLMSGVGFAGWPTTIRVSQYFSPFFTSFSE